LLSSYGFPERLRGASRATRAVAQRARREFPRWPIASLRPGLTSKLGHPATYIAAIVADGCFGVRPLVVWKAEFAAAEEIDAGQRGAPVALDVFDHQVGSLEVADEGGLGGVVHGVGHVAHEGDVQALIDELADAERSA